MYKVGHMNVHWSLLVNLYALLHEEVKTVIFFYIICGITYLLA